MRKNVKSGGTEVMGMLKSIGLENYKCFKKETNIDIAPLTILCGINSSGKSSILKSLLMLKQSYENTLSFNELTFNGKYVDNGCFKDVVYMNNGNFFKISNSFEITRPPRKKDKGISESDATTFNELLKIFKIFEQKTKSRIDLIKITISIDVRGLADTDSVATMLKNTIEEYLINIELFKTQKDNLSKINENDITISLKKVHEANGSFFGRIYDVDIHNIPYDANEGTFLFENIIPSCSCYFEGVKLVKLYKKNPNIDNISMILPNLYAIFRIISYQYKNIKHISPLRNMPNRRYIFEENVNFTGIGGEHTAQALYYYNKKLIMFTVPPENDILMPNNRKLDTLMTATKEWANYFGIGEVNIEPFQEMLKLNISHDNIVDVGFGISQGLPVIISGLLLNKHETLLLEQPEIHLHPNMQMKMADFLISQAYNKKNIICETHSDHILNRIIRRVMEDKTGKLQQLVKIYFVQGKNIDNPIYKDISIHPVDGLINAPEEFFTQFGSETIRIAQTGMINMREGVKW